ncbi:MAG: undecaprenyl-diphosphate phosphatase [Lachnospiraceae bacterium]|nr:undecaprenyl-diphosphate phosphatase [Lachnospiraceae bacterium]
MSFPDWLRVILLGIVEGVTEWIPVSSTGHLIILDRIWKGNETVFTADFVSMFNVIIQLGAILAVLTIFFHKLNPVSSYKTDVQKQNTWKLWLKILIAAVPAGLAGLLLDDFMDEHLFKWWVVALMLILYGALFILIETKNRKEPDIIRFSHLSYKTALIIGLIQILALIPGTSRSGVTILGAMFLGCSRYLATEFTFYLAIPIMLGASVLKLFKYIFIKHMAVSGTQFAVLVLAAGVAYLVSLFVIRFMLRYVKRHDFKTFGAYRIVLGLVVLFLFGLILK